MSWCSWVVPKRKRGWNASYLSSVAHFLLHVAAVAFEMMGNKEKPKTKRKKKQNTKHKTREDRKGRGGLVSLGVKQREKGAEDERVQVW